MSDRFVALDVETANPDFSSICAVGIAVFEGDEIAASDYSLVDPQDEFSGFNINIHGITPDDVFGAPSFPEFAPRLVDRLEDEIVVTHTAFDRAALRQVHARYGLSSPVCRWLDTARVVRRAWPDQFASSGYGLANVAEWCGIRFDHHNALEDAKAAGLILRRAVNDTELSVEDWLERTRRIDGSSGSFRREGRTDGPLYGEQACFTGALSMVRREAADLAAQAGCDVVQSVSRNTTLLVVGKQDLSALAGHKKSSKHRKAEELIRQGHPIRIIGEHDFLCLVEGEDQ